MAWLQARRRGLRSLALFAAVFVAAAGFTILTGSSEASRLETVGTVEELAQTNYDILVRPTGSRTEQEESKGVVQSGFLSGEFGGISLQQWRKIQAISGVEVAAPIAMVGYAVPLLRIPVNFKDVLPRDEDSVARVDETWVTDNGLSQQQSPPDFAFVTSKPLRFLEGNEGDEFWGITIAGKERKICPTRFVNRGLVDEDRPSVLRCMSWDGSGDDRGESSLPKDGVGTSVAFPFPFLIAAVDPESEEALSGLSSAVTSGKPLASSGVQHDQDSFDGSSVPVLIADTPQTELTLQVSTSLVAPDGVNRVLNDAYGNQLRDLPTTQLGTTTMTSADLYPQLIEALTTSGGDYFDTNNISQMFTISTPDYQSAGDAPLTPTVQPNSITEQFLNADTQAAPPTMGDVAVRDGQSAQGRPGTEGNRPQPATLRFRGTFDPTALSGLDGLTNQLLSGLAASPLTGADQATQQLLNNQPLNPSPNVTGLAQPAPMMLTSISALAPLQEGWTGRPDELGQEPPGARTEQAPVSAIRVRVTGVSGVDEVSRERVRVVADRIRKETGLSVDITVGSSPYKQSIRLPAGNYGRPELLLEQQWLKKGVATTILRALDRKSLAVFALVLLVSGLSVANSATAAVRTRRRELGVLSSLGWRQSDLFRSVLSELTLVALIAGLMAAIATTLLSLTTDLPISPGRALLAIPAALLVATLAGLGPAWSASRVAPLEAVQTPAASNPKDAARRGISSVVALGLTNLRRARVRTALAASGLAVAIAAFAILLSVTFAFQGAAVGTLMGHAVTIQVRTVDYVAAGATLVLAMLGIVNVLILNIRDRGSELATLQAVGWDDRAVVRLISVEGLGIGLLGAVPGLLIGLTAASLLTDTLDSRTVMAAAAACGVGLVASALAGLVPVALVRRLPVALLLTEETA